MTRITSALLAFAAAALILVGGLTPSWWAQPGESRQEGALHWSIGLREARLCGPERCTQATLDRIEWSEPWFRAGTAAYAAALLAGGLLLAAASGLALGRRGSLLISTALVAVVSAGVTGALFVWLMPEYPDIAASYSMVAFFAGVVTGVLACLLGLRMSAGGAT